MEDLKSSSFVNLRPGLSGRVYEVAARFGQVILLFSGWLWVGRGNRSFHSAEAVLRLVVSRGRWLASASQRRKIK
mgnify:CR=1 FL=1